MPRTASATSAVSFHTVNVQKNGTPCRNPRKSGGAPGGGGGAPPGGPRGKEEKGVGGPGDFRQEKEEEDGGGRGGGGGGVGAQGGANHPHRGPRRPPPGREPRADRDQHAVGRGGAAQRAAHVDPPADGEQGGDQDDE